MPHMSIINLAKAIKKYGFFQFEDDLHNTPWHVQSPLNLAPTNESLPKFKYHFPKSSFDKTIPANDDMIAFSSACHNFGAKNNDTCMQLFMNSLQGKIGIDFFELPPKSFSTWEDICCSFKSTYGKSKNPTNILFHYNNVSLLKG